MMENLPPYPRFGECIAVLAGALDIKKVDSDVGRLSREGDFDWEKLEAVVEELLIKGSANVVGDAAHQIFAPWLSTVREDYTLLVLDVSLDALDRASALPILIEGFFVPATASLLQRASSVLPGPDLRQFLSQENFPLDAIFQWLDGFVHPSFEKVLYPQSTDTDRVEREKVRKWRAGTDIPSSQSIKLLCRRLQTLPAMGGHAAAVALWMTFASALTRLERAWGEPFRTQLVQHLGENRLDGRAVRSSLRAAVASIAESWPGLALAGRKLWFELRRTTPKRLGEQGDAWREIEELEAQARHLDPQGRTAYHYPWMKGRWHVLSGEYQEALPYYEQAFAQACYRAGYQVKDLVAEATCIAAFLEKKVFLRQLKHVGIALGLFQKQSSPAVLENWEFEQFAHQLLILFPAQGRYPESKSDLCSESKTGLMAISKETIAEYKADLKKPNRVRAVQFSNGAVRRWPQLRMFASFGKVAEVTALLQAGASVDDLDSAGASALLCALQHAEATGEREVLDLLLAQSHEASTVNAATHRKRLTPLMCAIDYGSPDVVQALLTQGADTEQRALTDGQSPLYYLVSQLFCMSNPKQVIAMLVAKSMQAPDIVLKDSLRRFGAGPAGTFGADNRLLQMFPGVGEAIASHLVNHRADRHSGAKLMEIAALLLKAGANPNAAHQYPVPGRTPLMLAAENDLPELFDSMLQHGGDPLRPDAMGNNCWHISNSFRARKVMDYLQQMPH